MTPGAPAFRSGPHSIECHGASAHRPAGGAATALPRRARAPACATRLWRIVRSSWSGDTSSAVSPLLGGC